MLKVKNGAAEFDGGSSAFPTERHGIRLSESSQDMLKKKKASVAGDAKLATVNHFFQERFVEAHPQMHHFPMDSAYSSL